MDEIRHPVIAIVGVGAVLPDAPDAEAFWKNIRDGRYSISDVPTERWDPELFYDPDPKAPAKTYSKIGGWVSDWDWDPMAWRLPIPPRVSEAMDRTQKWAVIGARQALADYGYPERSLDPERTAVILGNAMGGDQHYLTALRIHLPEYELELARAESFSRLEPDLQEAIRREFHERIAARYPEITEDSMPGELANIIAGRVANLFDFHGPNFVVDAACASAMAAIGAAIEGLEERDFDAVITGGIDANMSASTFTKFCKIGALSSTGTRPFAAGADGFVMGEGAAIFLLKRFEDAERDGDPIYALIRGVGGSSDGKGKGITAPNPVGQRLAVERAWQRAGVDPDSATLIEGHGTSTRVGDVVEVESLAEAFRRHRLPVGALPLGSVKSNIGHLKGAAGAAGLLKAAFALRDRVLPPSLGCEQPNPKIDFASCPFYVNRELQEWATDNGGVRRAGVSAFGFGGTNFHVVLEEYRAGEAPAGRRSAVRVARVPASTVPISEAKPPPRGALVIGADDESGLAGRLQEIVQRLETGRVPEPAAPSESDLGAACRLAIDYGDAGELGKLASKALTILESGRREAWKPLRARGVFFGQGPAPRVALLFTGQGSQYLNMLRELRRHEPVVAQVFERADEVMTPLLGRPLSEYLFLDGDDPAVIAAADEALRQTAITQPAVLTVDIALTRLLAAHGMTPDFVMGHSLGEYGALVAAGSMDFRHALEAVSARGAEMMKLAVKDNGGMAAVFAPLEEIERILDTVDGYVVVANHNSPSEAVIGGATEAVDRAVVALSEAGYDAKRLPVSHAFHTQIVAPVSEPLRGVLERMELQPPSLPIVANVDGEFYPMGPGVVPEMVDILTRQVSHPVQFVKGLQTLYRAGARVFVEVGPKRALQGMVRGVFHDRDDVLALSTNHPRLGDLVSFNHALCGLWAAGLGVGSQTSQPAAEVVAELRTPVETPRVPPAPPVPPPAAEPSVPVAAPGTSANAQTYLELGRLFADVLDRGMKLYSGARPEAPQEPVVITGVSLGLPGNDRVFDDHNAERLLTGQQFIEPIPDELRQAMVAKNITRLVKTGGGGPRFETIQDASEVIKLAARAGKLDLVEEFGYPAKRDAALDIDSELAIGAGLEALRDAGLPLVRRYKTTTKGTQLPDSWALPEALRDDTGVIFASAFPGIDFFANESKRYHRDQARRRWLAELQELRSEIAGGDSDGALAEVDRRIERAQAELESDPYTFERRFLFKVLSMGHSQFAELIGARGPNTQINAACASGTQAVALAEDWIRAGRCQRVIIISADNVTSDEVLEWFGAGFLASGAAATDAVVEDAAIPFDRRRHGMIIGMGAAGLVVESRESARARGLQPICEVLSTVTANSAFHGTRLDVEHISEVMESLMRQAEERWGVDRHAIAPETVFISHETYTPARGGSAQAEIFALRRVFGPAADQIVIANTKGYTGHPMAVAMEDVLAVRSLETGLVPPVANIKEIDPELGALNLSQGGNYPVRYALRLGAGFGSQISMSLLRLEPALQGRRPRLDQLGYAFRIADPSAWQGWLNSVSGYSQAHVEVEHRTLRVCDNGPPSEVAAVPAAALQGAPAQPPAAVATPVADTSPVAEPAVVPEPTAVPVADAVQARVLAIVAEMTGYPEDMLDLDLDMEADLGIDTVKQAEMFAAIRQEWDIPRDDTLQLRDFPTLAHAIQFVYDRRPDLEPQAAASAVATEAPASAPAQPAATAAVVSPGSADVEPATAGPPAAAPTPERVPGADPVAERILALVAELTGYPEDMLDLDLDMEADLGIDTVKQAEMFAAIRQEWDIPRDDTLQLRDFPTLAHAIQFVYDRRPDLTATTGQADSPTEGETTATAEAAAQEAEVGPGSTMRAPRRVAVAVLRPPLERCKATGVPGFAGRRIVVMPDEGGVAVALARDLDRQGAEVLLVEGEPQSEPLDRVLAAWLDAGRVDGVFWLPALDPEGELIDLAPEEWLRAVEVRVKLMHTTMQRLYDAIAERDTFLVVGTRLGGRHGYDERGALAPLGGAASGFAKAYKRERPEALVKVVDFAAETRSTEIAAALVAETLRDPGVVEVGYCDDLRWTVSLEERPIADDVTGIDLGEEPVFVVTGAAGSIVSAIIADLVERWPRGHFYLLDLTPEPDPDDPDLELLQTDREALKRTLIERLKQQGEKATPADIERRLAALERSRAALEALQAIATAGGQGHYHAVDLLAAQAVAEVMSEIGERHGHIDVLVHAAGIEISHRLADKSRREFDLVFDVKARGWFHLLKSVKSLPLGATVVFSSIAGRFGNAGQTDYSAANDLLCKLTSALKTSRPDTRGIAIDWTAWADIGMAARGSIPKMMELAGIDMLPPAVGIPVVGREISAGVGEEIVVAGSLGALLEEWDETGGVDPSFFEQASHGPMIGNIVGFGLHDGLTVETTLDPRQQAFLFDHRIDGTAVLPGVMGIEAFAELARAAAPDWQVAAIEDVEFRAPFKFYRDQPRTLLLQATLAKDGDELTARCRLIGRRTLAKGERVEETEHFTGTVRLARGSRPSRSLPAPEAPPSGLLAPEAIYSIYFHGPAYRVVDGAWRNGDGLVARFAEELGPHHHPAELATITDPRRIELCFQAAGLLELATSERVGLPLRVSALRLFESAAEARAVQAIVRPSHDGAFEVVAIDGEGEVLLEMEGYATVASPLPVDSKALVALRTALAVDTTAESS